MSNYNKFHVVARPGYFGKKRAEKEAYYNGKFGDTWRECWEIYHWSSHLCVLANNPAPRQILSFDEAV